MDIKITAVHFDADVKLKEFINEKLSKLLQFHDQIIAAEVFLKVAPARGPEGNKITEVKLFIPGKDLFVEKMGKSFEEATDECTEALIRQLVKRKEKVRGV
ncbi:MAG: ribosome hibernation-promoting factor, HPF/YfiA family [Luteibaculaceae bacterium]